MEIDRHRLTSVLPCIDVPYGNELGLTGDILSCLTLRGDALVIAGAVSMALSIWRLG